MAKRTHTAEFAKKAVRLQNVLARRYGRMAEC